MQTMMVAVAGREPRPKEEEEVPQLRWHHLQCPSPGWIIYHLLQISDIPKRPTDDIAVRRQHADGHDLYRHVQLPITHGNATANWHGLSATGRLWKL